MERIKITVGNGNNSIGEGVIYAGKQKIATFWQDKCRGLYFAEFLLGGDIIELSSAKGIDDILKQCHIEVQKIVDNIYRSKK